MVWAYARMQVADEPLLHAIASRSMPLIQEFAGPDLAISAWSWAKLEYRDRTLWHAISAAALTRILEFASQNLANFVWA